MSFKTDHMLQLPLFTQECYTQILNIIACREVKRLMDIMHVAIIEFYVACMALRKDR